MLKAKLSFIVFTGIVSVSTAFAADKLNSTQIIKAFSGKTAECVKTKDKSTCSTYMSERGQVKRHMRQSGKQRTGKWHAAGHQLCILWSGKSKDLCFDIQKQGNGDLHLVRKGKVKSVITGFKNGDQSGF